MNALNLTLAQVTELKALIELKEKKDAENQAKADEALLAGNLANLLDACENEYTVKICELLQVSDLPVNEDTIDQIKAI